MTPDGRIPTAILGAGGYVGQQFARLLGHHPLLAPPLLVGSTRSRGQRLGELWRLVESVPTELEDARLEPLGPAALARSGVRIVFSALPSGTAGKVESELARRGLHVFTNASDHRLDPSVPLLIPEVNGDHLELLRHRTTTGVIVANPNCTATGLALGLAPLVDLLAPRSVYVATYQALSGAGLSGLASVATSDNVLPLIAGEEEKVERETARLLGRRRGGQLRPWPSPIVSHCARVGVRDGHLEAVTVVAGRRPRVEAIARAWKAFDPLHRLRLPTAPHPPVVLRSEPDRPQPRLDRWAGAPATARGMAAVVGRVRWNAPHLRFFVLTHNGVRGAAGGSVLNAEYFLARQGLVAEGGGDSRAG
ncbi:MAG: aspartate-semialdehyde dehydrogenase [Thermoplasmata archaeon]|nr:aspartate-semialdehyde dehydrogenase [Thermoplasmata archaeon]